MKCNGIMGIMFLLLIGCSDGTLEKSISENNVPESSDAEDNLTPGVSWHLADSINDGEIRWLIANDGSSMCFTATDGFCNYTWYVDAVETACGETFCWKVEQNNFSLGKHWIMVVMKDGAGNSYSAQREFVVTKENAE